jgi:hypothetical protein
VAADTLEGTSLFELDGREYEVPDWTDVDISEWEIIYDECEVGVSDFQEQDDPEKEAARMKRVRNPRLEKAFIMVALRRVRPDDDLDTLREEAGKVKLIPYLLRGGEQENPTQATRPDESSSKSSDSSNGNSSQDSSENSETQEEGLATTGMDG